MYKLLRAVNFPELDCPKNFYPGDYICALQQHENGRFSKKNCKNPNPLKLYTSKSRMYLVLFITNECL